ncbi:MAG: ABC transporter permease [Candidatus Saccharimonadia bacterium]
MSVITRGAKNAFRNLIRSFSIILILGISIALALIMLLSMRTVENRISSIQSSIANTITVSPAGSRGFSGGGNPLTTENVAQVNSTEHVTSVISSISDRLSTTGQTSPFPSGSTTGTTNLVSSIDAGSLGRRFGGSNGSGGNAPVVISSNANFTLPISVTGTTNPTSTQVAVSNQLKITSGSNIDGNGSGDVAIIGTSLATKNNLKVGSTFTAYGKTITVSGIFDAGNTFNNGGIIMPLATVQTLSAQVGDVTQILVNVDNINNVSATVTALENKLGSAADVTSAQSNANDALAPLENIKTISLYSLIGSLVAGSIIIFLTMLMIVRERRREIGVLKAIGASNIKIMIQFVTESLTLTILAAIIGVAAGVALSNPVLKILVTTNTASSPGGGGGGSGGGIVRAFGRVGGSISQLHTVIGWEVLLYGLGAAIIIAVLGSAIPAFVIAKVRPAEVMRTE